MKGIRNDGQPRQNAKAKVIKALADLGVRAVPCEKLKVLKEVLAQVEITRGSVPEEVKAQVEAKATESVSESQ